MTLDAPINVPMSADSLVMGLVPGALLSCPTARLVEPEADASLAASFACCFENRGGSLEWAREGLLEATLTRVCFMAC